MTRPSRKVLAAIGDWETFRRLEPLLARDSLEVNRVTDGPSCLALAASIRYDLLLAQARLPGTTPEALVRGLRLATSQSRRAPLLLLTTPGYSAAPSAPASSDADGDTLRVSPDELWEAVSRTLGLAMRVTPRLPVDLQVEASGEPGGRTYRMLNLSSSGMLLRTPSPVEVGARVPFSFGLPEDPAPVSGLFQVVRHASRSREQLAAMGVRFLRLEGDGAERVDRFVGGEIARAEAAQPSAQAGGGR